jgi:hypothetical protein
MIVMKMDLDIAEAAAHHLRDTVEQIAPILLLRVEEAVLGRLSVCVLGGLGGDLGPAIAPPGNSAEGGLDGRPQA